MTVVYCIDLCSDEHVAYIRALRICTTLSQAFETLDALMTDEVWW